MSTFIYNPKTALSLEKAIRFSQIIQVIMERRRSRQCLSDPKEKFATYQRPRTITGPLVLSKPKNLAGPTLNLY